MCCFVQENNKIQGKSRFTSPKAVGRKSKSRLQMDKSQQELNEINKGEIVTDTKPLISIETPAHTHIIHLQQQSLGRNTWLP
jgi:hypothetical protein